MITIIQATYIFLDAIKILIIFDIILSWLTIFGINIKIKFIKDLIIPLYRRVKKIFPTTIGFIDFTPIIILIGLEIIKYAIFIIFQDIVIGIN